MYSTEKLHIKKGIWKIMYFYKSYLQIKLVP